MTSCRLVNSRRCFGGGRCLHFQLSAVQEGSARTARTLKVKAAGYSAMFVSSGRSSFYSRGLEYWSPPWTLKLAVVSAAKRDISFVAAKDWNKAVFCLENLLPGASYKWMRRNWQFVTYLFFLTTFSVALRAAFACRDWQKARRTPAGLFVCPSRFELGTPREYEAGVLTTQPRSAMNLKIVMV